MVKSRHIILIISYVSAITYKGAKYKISFKDGTPNLVSLKKYKCWFLHIRIISTFLFNPHSRKKLRMMDYLKSVVKQTFRILFSFSL